MPKVGNKHYPYTAKGKAMAKKEMKEERMEKMKGKKKKK